MKNWLRIAVVLLCLLLTAAFAEEAVENVVVYFADGAKVLLPAEIANDAAKLEAYCAAYFPGRSYSCDAAAAFANYDAILSEAWVKAQYGENSRAMQVNLVMLGLNETKVITSAGEELTVPTNCLKFSDHTDAKHLLGIVYAPKSGEASIRETASGSAKVIETAKTGRIVAVLEYAGGTYAKVRYDGVEGYIRTDCLIFHDGAKAALGNGTLHVKSKTDGKDTVTVRSETSNSKAKVAAWPTGTSVIVHESDDKWCAVEYNGWFGYVQAQYLTLD